MRPLICPQCGGQIDEYVAGATFTTCEYCSTKFLIEPNKAPKQPPAKPVDFDMPPTDVTEPFVKIIGVVIGVIVVVSLISLLVFKGAKPGASSVSSVPSVFRSSPTPSPTPEPDRAILRFGGTGAENGLFDDASSIAVDKQGQIYVADNKLRVQQFDAQGVFLKLLKVPANGRNYERARVIDKIAVASDGRLFVAVGGVILIYSQNWAAAPRVVHVAPDFIQDFYLKADGSMLAVADNDRIETLIYVNKNGGVTRRVEGFHTDALEASIAPLATAAESVRIAVDSAGNIFSVYALGALGSYSISHNTEDLAIARLTPAAKFVKKFDPVFNASALVVDQKNRLCISTRESVVLLDADGNNVGHFRANERIDAFTLDKDGYIYTIANNTVAKYEPVP